MPRTVDLQTQSRKHFGRITYDLNGQIKDSQSVFEPFQTSLQKVNAALVHFRGFPSRAQSEEDAFCFWGHGLSKNVDKLRQIVTLSRALLQCNQNVTSQMRTRVRLSHLEHNSD